MATNANKQCLQVRGLSHAYGDTTTFAGLETELCSGELVAVLGPSGAGKSTFLRVLAGLIAPTSGTVSIGGVEASQARRAKQIALVPQHPALMEWRTAAENVQLSLEINATPGDRASRVQKALADVGMAPFANRFPRELSGGQQQRVALARALVLDAPVLLLDEPFSSADEMTKRALYDVVKHSVLEGTQMAVMVTHSLDEAVANATRVLVLGGQTHGFLGEVPLGDLRLRTEAIEAGNLRGLTPTLLGLLQQASQNTLPSKATEDGQQ